MTWKGMTFLKDKCLLCSPSQMTIYIIKIQSQRFGGLVCVGCVCGMGGFGRVCLNSPEVALPPPPISLAPSTNKLFFSVSHLGSLLIHRGAAKTALLLSKLIHRFNLLFPSNFESMKYVAFIHVALLITIQSFPEAFGIKEIEGNTRQAHRLTRA